MLILNEIERQYHSNLKYGANDGVKEVLSFRHRKTYGVRFSTASWF